MASLSGYFSAYLDFKQPTWTIAKGVGAPVTADFNRDGYQDLLVLGSVFPAPGLTNTNQQGVLFYGTPTGFTPAPQEFPWLTALATVHPRKVLVEDFNGDDKLDVFVADHGWDTFPFPGHQNLLILSTPTGWTDATASLPQLNDFTHTAASGDIDGDGDLDIFVGNGFRGENAIHSYMLVNDGSGHFSMTRANIPVGHGEVMDFNTLHMFPGAEFVDLNGDALPELVITADATADFNAMRENVILWNQGGSFNNNDKTQLPANGNLPNQIVSDVKGMDVNSDGRTDLVFTGTQGEPYYNGWFVQLMLAQADGSFVDATSWLMAPGDRAASGAGTWGMFVQPLDFNHDGYIDFAIEMNGPSLQAATPLVWLNDSTGHFTTLKAGDFTDQLWRLGGGHWYETQHGWSTINAQPYNTQGQLPLAGMTATQPYLLTPDSGLARTGAAGDDRLRGDDVSNTLVGHGGIDTAVYLGNRASFTVDAHWAGNFTVARHGSADVDTLLDVERLEFRDAKVAMDLQGNAGKVAKLLGAVFSPAAVGSAEYAGIGLDFADAGMTYEALAELALGAALGGNATNEQVVTLLYTNVAGVAPGADALQAYAGLLHSGQLTRGEIGVLAAEQYLNAVRINFDGLVETGLAYL